MGLLSVAIIFNCGFLDDEPCSTAAEHGYLGRLKLMHRHKFKWTVGTLDLAAFGRHIHVLRWMWANKCPRKHEAVATYAAEGGHQAAIHWARVKNCLFGAWTFRAAAERGDIGLTEDARTDTLSTRASGRPSTGTSRRSGGPGRKDAAGTSLCARMLLGVGTWRCSSTHASTGARGAQTPLTGLVSASTIKL